MSSVLSVYNRSKLDISHAKGVYLYTTDDKKYIDFVSGVAVNCLGHCHPSLVSALKEQSEKLWQISNLYRIPGLDEFAQSLTDACFADRVFFCNSGAEAIECCVKTVRKYHDANGNPDKFRIITFTGAFHGRTLAALWASKRDPLMQEGFGPAVEGFDNVEFNDLQSVKSAIGDETAAILVEPIQGDGGIRVSDAEFLKGLRTLADEHGLLLCFDEIQCGYGRSGKLFAHELYGVTPDILTSAKAIGGGFPLGACLMNEKAASGMTIGTHGSTYGGNPLAMAVGREVLKQILSDGFLDNVVELGEYLQQKLSQLKNSYPNIIEEVRGTCLIMGLKLKPNNKEFASKAEENGLLLACASDNVIRILPPLNIEKTQLDEAIEILDLTMQGYK